MKDQGKLKIREKLGYSLGDCASNFVFQTQLVFLMSFYTDVFGITASTVGTILLFSRIWDGFNDPVMGALADRTNTRWGMYRPWLIWTAVPLALCFVLAYTTPNVGSTLKVIWAFVTYNMLMMAYTANNIPYSALTGVITGDNAERASLVSWRFILAMTAGMIVQTFTLDLVAVFGKGDDALGYQLTMALWATIGVVFYVIAFATTKERIKPDPRQKTSVASDIRDLVGNKPWMSLSLATALVFLYLSMRGGMGIYYFRYIVIHDNAEGLFGWFNGVGALTTLVGISLSKMLSLRFGKRDTYIMGLVICAFFTACFYFVPPENVTLIFVLQGVLQFFYGITIPLTWAMIADVADFSEWKSGRRATAMVFATTVFALKVGLSLGSAISGWLLDYYGYIPNEVQSAETTRGILLMMSLFPAAAFVLACGALMTYGIDRPMEKTIESDLTTRRVLASSK